MPRRPDPKQLSNRQRLVRIEYLKSRRDGDKDEMKELTELSWPI